MKETDRVQRINNNLNKHFKSNRDSWWVSDTYKSKNMIALHHGIGGDRIKPIWIANFIFKTEASVDIIDSCGFVFTRRSVKNAR